MAKCLGILVRLTNFVVMLMGFGLLSYGLYLIIESKSISVLSGLALALGVIDATMGLLLTCCGSRSLFYLRLYSMVIGLLELAQIAVAALFLVDSTQEKIIDAINPPSDVRSWVESHLRITGYVLVATVAFQALALVLVFVSACYADKEFDESSSVDRDNLLGGYEGRSSKRKGKGDKWGDIESLNEPSTAADRYKDKHAKYYSKYGLK